MENQKKKKFFFFFFVKLGIFCLELGKKHTFWHWEWGRNRVIESPETRNMSIYNETRNVSMGHGCPLYCQIPINK